MATYYETLGLEPNATPDEIKAAYRAFAMRYHPDRHPEDPHAEEIFKVIQQAYECLSDPIKRAQYDATGSTEPQKDVTALAHEIISQMFINIANSLTEGGNPSPSISLARTNPFLILSNQIRDQALHIERQSQMNTIACDRLRNIRSRIENSAHPVESTSIYAAVSQQITVLEARNATIDRDRALNRKLSELSAQFTYRLDDNSQPQSSGVAGQLLWTSNA